jgi:uncharacterized protein (TIGR00297 family)
LSALPNAGLGIVGLFVGAFDVPAALVGLIAGTLLTYAFGAGGFVVLLAFVLLGASTTKLKYARKSSLGISEPGGGRRTWRSAVGNLLVPGLGACAAIAGLYGLAAVFTVGSIATAAFDTVASEVGKALSGSAVTLHDMKIRKAGARGGVSLTGTASGAAAGLIICLLAAALELITFDMLIWVLIGALIGTMIESLLKSGTGLRSAQAANIVNTAVGGLVSALLVSAVKVQ